MQSHEAIQEQIRRAMLARSLYAASLVSGAIAATWKAIAFAACVIAAAERSKDPDKLFTFEA
jgi:hypothetical protein